MPVNGQPLPEKQFGFVAYSSSRTGSIFDDFEPIDLTETVVSGVDIDPLAPQHRAEAWQRYNDKVARTEPVYPTDLAREDAPTRCITSRQPLLLYAARHTTPDTQPLELAQLIDQDPDIHLEKMLGRVELLKQEDVRPGYAAMNALFNYFPEESAQRAAVEGAWESTLDQMVSRLGRTGLRNYALTEYPSPHIAKPAARVKI